MPLTDSPSVDRLIRLLMMLPAPDRETHSVFWERVAEEHKVSTSYITGKIANNLQQILLPEGRPSAAEGLATYALFFFGEASDELVSDIASEIDAGAPNDSAGAEWVAHLRRTAFEVIEENLPEDRVRQATVEWIRAGQRRLRS